MRLYVHLTIVLFALHAHAATIQAPPSSPLELQKKLPQEPVKETVPAENVSSEQELIDSANTINDIDNNLRVKAIDSIPVKVIVEEPPVEDSADIKRVEIDLDNPGTPQRQEHETQNPVVYHEEQQIVTAVKQTVLDTQAALKQGFQNVADGIQNWFTNNEQLSSIQTNIQGLQISFNEQINKLNKTLQSYWNNNRVETNVAPTEVNKEPPKEIENVESHLKTLENNFQTGVKALTEGVEVFATLKADNENPTTQGPAPPNNLFIQYLTLFQNTLTQGFNNVTQAIQNYVGQGNNANSTQTSGGLFQGFNGIQNILNQGGQQTVTPAAGAQADEPATVRPTIWQGIQHSLQNILNPNQQTQASSTGQGGQAPATPNRPIAQAIQNLPFVQGVVNLIQPNKPAAQPEKPVQPAEPTAQPAQEGSNSVPTSAETESKPEADVPTKASEEPSKTEQQPAKPEVVNGPIRNIIQNNPIVKGISGAVQRLQASINPNAERPRDPVKEVSQKGDTKGHHGGNAVDNNSSVGVAVKNAPVEDVKIEVPVPEVNKVTEESKPETVKTEQS